MTGIETIEADGITVEDIVTFGYDALGQKTSAVDGDSSLAWSYDTANRVATAETVAAIGAVQPAVVLTHAYDAVGNRESLTHGPDGVVVDGAWGYLHDGNGALTRVTTPTTEIVELAYDIAGRLETITSANTVEMNVLYDALTGRPGGITHKLGAATLANFGYGFDTDGKILSIADSGGTRSFTYDPTLQLTGGGYASAPETYAYDPEGNRTNSHLSASYTHDLANRLREDDTTCYAYDANGNMTGKRVKIGLDCTTDVSGATTAYEWDALNRLVRIDNPDGTYAAYRYDAQGRRIEKDVNASITRYVYDDDAILLEYNGANALQASYSHGEEVDQPLAMTRGGASYFYGVDHLGTPQRLTDGATGTVAWDASYSPFGEATITGALTFNLRFPGQYLDAETGLHYNGFRDYDPTTGRYIQSDPIGLDGGLNTYGYVGGNPITLIDPLGQRFRVEQRGQAVYIMMQILVDFSPNSSEITKWQAGVDQYWNTPTFKYMNCDVRFLIEFVDSGYYDNVVKLQTNGPANAQYGSQDGPPRTGKWYRKSTAFTAAHEVGHFLGLRDDYKNIAPPKKKRRTIPLPGHGGHIMGDYGGTVAPHELNDLMSTVTCGCQ